MVWRVPCMIHTIHLHKETELITCKAWAIVGDTVSGMPNWVKRVLNCWIVAREVALCIGNTSIHLVCAPTITRKMRLLRGSVKSMWSLDTWYLWHSWHSHTVYSISCSITGHHMCTRDRPFILAIPCRPSCSSVRTCFHLSMKIRTREPHKM